MTARNQGGEVALDIGGVPYAPTSQRGDGFAYFMLKKNNAIVKVGRPDTTDPAAKKLVTQIPVEPSLEGYQSLQMSRGLFQVNG